MSLNAVVITPTYNNAATVVDVLCRVCATNLPLIVVDDGCIDNTSELLEGWVREGYPAVFKKSQLIHDHSAD